MSANISELVKAYHGITHRMIHVKMNDKIFIDTELRDQKCELGKQIKQAAVSVFKTQLSITQKYFVEPPYNCCLFAKGFYVKSYKIYKNRIKMLCVDTAYDRPDEYEIEIPFETIANFDETQYALSCIDKLIERQEDDISWLNDKIRKAGAEIEKLKELKSKLVTGETP